jgi:hypothetical protein
MIRLKNLLLEFDLNAVGELEKAKDIVKGLQSRGFSYTGAVALAGNISHESGCDPDTTEEGGTGGYGLMQWDPGFGRKQALIAFAKHIGKPKGALSTQLDFMKCELINGYLWNDKPVPGIDKSLMYYKQRDGSYKGLSNEYVKKYDRSIVAGDIAASAANLMDNVFKPIAGSKQQRIDNALKIDKFIKGKLPANTNTATAKNTTTTKSSIKYNMYPNPAKPGNMITINVSADILPLDSVDLIIYTSAGQSVDQHHWDNVQQGVLKFESPTMPGTYILKLNTGDSNTDHDLKLMVM